MAQVLNRNVTHMTDSDDGLPPSGIFLLPGEGRSYPMGRIAAVFKADGGESSRAGVLNFSIPGGFERDMPEIGGGRHRAEQGVLARGRRQGRDRAWREENDRTGINGSAG